MTEQEMQSEYEIQTLALVEHKDPLVIYHGNCADGFSAAWVFHHVQDKIEQAFDFHAGVYNEPPPDVSDRVVYLVDFSYKRQVVKDMILIGGAKTVILIDHHKTAIEDLAGLSEELEKEWNEQEEKEAYEIYDQQFLAYTDLNMSGATLAWKYWVEQKILQEAARPTLLGHIEDRDLWKFKLPLTREIQANVFSYEYTFENWDKLMLSTSTIKLAEGGESIERKHMKDVRELVAKCTRFPVYYYPNNGLHWEPQEGVSVAIPFASIPYTMASDAGHIMAEAHENGKWFSVCYYDTDDYRIFSLRSTDEGIDVSEIAKFYGGGGHKHAAGFRVDRNHWLAQIQQQSCY